jgi:hypothetical protein
MTQEQPVDKSLRGISLQTWVETAAAIALRPPGDPLHALAAAAEAAPPSATAEKTAARKAAIEAKAVRPRILIVGNAPGPLKNDPANFDEVLGFNDLNGFDWLGPQITRHVMRMSANGGRRYGGEELALRHGGQLVLADRVECPHVVELEKRWHAAGRRAELFTVRWPGMPYQRGKTPSTGYSVVLWYHSQGWRVTVERFTFKGASAHDWDYEAKALRALADEGKIVLVEQPQAKKVEEAPAQEPQKAAPEVSVRKARTPRVVACLSGSDEAVDLALALADGGMRVMFKAGLALPARATAAISDRKATISSRLSMTASLSEIFVCAAGDMREALELAGASARTTTMILSTGAAPVGESEEILSGLVRRTEKKFSAATENINCSVARIVRRDASVFYGLLQPSASIYGETVLADLMECAGISGARQVDIKVAEALAIMNAARAEMADWVDARALESLEAAGTVDMQELREAAGRPVTAAAALGACPSTLKELLSRA